MRCVGEIKLFFICMIPRDTQNYADGKEDAMRTRTLIIGLVCLSSAAVWAGGKFQPLDVKTGLWETTTTNTHSGEMPLPAELLDRLTPEQRARMEARMKANSAR